MASYTNKFYLYIITTYYVGKMNVVENIITPKNPDLNSLIEVFTTLSLAKQRSKGSKKITLPKKYSVNNLNRDFKRLTVTDEYSRILKESLLNTRENKVFTRATNPKYFKELLPVLLLKKIVKPKSKHLRVTKKSFKR